MSVGENVIDQIIASKLFTVSCPDSPDSSCLVVWSANAPEQLSAMLSEYAAKRRRDLDSIRFAMQQALDTFDVFAKVADKTDEATLSGMRAMLAAFDAEVRMCDSR
jgi:hypothetical protein